LSLGDGPWASGGGWVCHGGRTRREARVVANSDDKQAGNTSWPIQIDKQADSVAAASLQLGNRHERDRVNGG
jgi:hypothetical protein